MSLTMEDGRISITRCTRDVGLEDIVLVQLFADGGARVVAQAELAMLEFAKALTIQLAHCTYHVYGMPPAAPGSDAPGTEHGAASSEGASGGEGGGEEQ